MSNRQNKKKQRRNDQQSNIHDSLVEQNQSANVAFQSQSSVDQSSSRSTQPSQTNQPINQPIDPSPNQAVNPSNDLSSAQFITEKK
jgi:hypothetical protein